MHVPYMSIRSRTGEEPCYSVAMIDIRIQTGGDPGSLAELIASTQGEDIDDPRLAELGTIVRTQRVEAAVEREPWPSAQTVDFVKLDPDNDWTDV